MDFSEAWNSLVKDDSIRNVDVNSLIKQTKLLSNLKLIFQKSVLYRDEEQEQMVNDLLNCYVRNNGNIHDFLEFYRKSVLDKFKMSDKDFNDFLELNKQNPLPSQPNPNPNSNHSNPTENSSNKPLLSSSDSLLFPFTNFNINDSHYFQPIHYQLILYS